MRSRDRGRLKERDVSRNRGKARHERAHSEEQKCTLQKLADANNNNSKCLWRKPRAIAKNINRDDYEGLLVRHVNQLFVRGDNVVMVAFADG